MSVILELTQAGSGTNAIHAAKGDTITIALAETVHSSILANALVGLNGLANVLGVTFVLDSTGDAS